MRLAIFRVQCFYSTSIATGDAKETPATTGRIYSGCADVRPRIVGNAETVEKLNFETMYLKLKDVKCKK
jgi:hypothetical protein